LKKLLGQSAEHAIEGAQVKVNMLLKRLPRLKAGTDPVAAFGGTFHINENFEQLQVAFEQANRGEIPNPLPCEIYCHSLTDPSILGPELQASGAQTLTVFALHTPHSLLKGRDNNAMRDAFEQAVIASINSVLDEDIRDLLLTDVDGMPCIETKTTQDLEDALGLPGGNIFHAPLSWPFVGNDAVLDTPAQRWGVDSGIEGILFCGSTAQRGGAVSGIAGHNAAMAVIESLGLVAS
jgi:phytoene dehydrogenase-like protein